MNFIFKWMKKIKILEFYKMNYKKLILNYKLLKIISILLKMYYIYKELLRNEF